MSISNRQTNNYRLRQTLSNERIDEVEEEEEDCNSLLLMNPNASEEELASPSSPTSLEQRQRSGSFGTTPHKYNGATSKQRSKSPSFFKMIVGGFGGRKTSNDELITKSSSACTLAIADQQQRGSFSDTEDVVTFYSPNSSEDIVDEERLRLNHFATLPRKEWRRPSTDKMTHITWHSSSYSPEEIRKQESLPVLTDKHSPVSPDTYTSSDSPLFSEIPLAEDYQPTGLDALEMLHNQLQILVRQDCDQEMGDVMNDKVVESLQKQNSDLQRSLECLQSSDQNLRVSLRMAEMRAQEAEIKLHHSNDKCHKLERDCRWLETEFKILYQKYHELQRHLQKKAILHQMSLSPSRTGRRPNSAQARRQRSFDAVNGPTFASVKRHNSSEFIHKNQYHHHPHTTSHNTIGYSHHHKNHTVTSSPSSSNTLPRVHSGSLSHTETRV